MASYTIHIKRQARDPEVARERAVFVRDGWHGGAFAFGPFWLLAKGHVVLGLAAIVLQFGALGALAGLGMRPDLLLLASFLLALLWGLEGASLRRLALHLSRHDMVGLVVAGSLDEAERRHFTEIEAELAVAPAPPTGGFVPHGPANPVMGLFPQARGSA